MFQAICKTLIGVRIPILPKNRRPPFLLFVHWQNVVEWQISRAFVNNIDHTKNSHLPGCTAWVLVGPLVSDTGSEGMWACTRLRAALTRPTFGATETSIKMLGLVLISSCHSITIPAVSL